MSDEKNHQRNALQRGEEFLRLFNEGKAFTEELMKENERLRHKIASIEDTRSGQHEDNLAKEVARLRERISDLEEEHKMLLETHHKVEEENKDFASRYIEIEEQNNNLANLYVASYQLHSTLDFQEVLQIVVEIVINLIGSEAFSIMLVDEKTNELKTLACEGAEMIDGMDTLSIKVGEGAIGKVAKTGESYFINQAPSDAPVDLLNPLVAIPLKIKEHVIGTIVIYRLLQQKDSFSAVDYELFSLLAGQAATAIFAAKLYSQSERKLTTIQSFLELLTTSS
ncbi:MAG TPA: GAF domain-containing protein [Thermoanaerobaculia bacterium]|nr:GAF domain-containing protein [Thermoanaerobaculia bacterium]HUM30779.1 GAF domain-containing protein [Thermoanaerobaculia bacterium]HXK69021.1 GAF domain-containing protein [Thermoanaerobaculia bacterium]